MSRWSPDARERLERAALDLFEEQGFAATTVPQIAQRAGLTTRTFFRHFADKREVLYADDQASAMARRALAEAPDDADPLTLIVDGIRRVAQEQFEGRRELIRRRRAIIMSDPGLLERAYRKWADLAEVVRVGFVERGLAAPTAALLAATCASLIEVALGVWLDQDGDRPLSDIAVDLLATLRAALADEVAGGRDTGPAGGS